jgi:hypothetical protein
LFNFPLASFLPPLLPKKKVVEICHFAGPPEAPTATADVAGGILGWPRTRPATVRKPLTSATPALPGRSPKPRISYSISRASTKYKVKKKGFRSQDLVQCSKQDSAKSTVGPCGPVMPIISPQAGRAFSTGKVTVSSSRRFVIGKSLHLPVQCHCGTGTVVLHLHTGQRRLC